MRLFNRSKKDQAETTTPEIKAEEITPSDRETAYVQPQSKVGDDKVTEKKADGDEEEEEDDETRYPKAMKLTLITIALCLAVFCMALDNTIIATAIPRITDEFHAIDDVSLV